MSRVPVVIDHLTHRYGNRMIYRDLSLSLEPGKIYGLLGKNGVGKTTLIKIMMGFLRPVGGHCRIFGDPANHLAPHTRRRVGLLFERHLAYDFFTIEQIEHFYSGFYTTWRSAVFWDMVDRLGLPRTQKISTMSEGQRSQIVLGLVMAQDPDLLILDDYSMGLDAGYRRLFIDYLSEHMKSGRYTIILTSHVIQDMDRFVDEILFLERGGAVLRTAMDDFIDRFSLFRLRKNSAATAAPAKGGVIKNVEDHPEYWEVFSFASAEEVSTALAAQGVDPGTLTRSPMSLEDAFVGYTGRY